MEGDGSSVRGVGAGGLEDAPDSGVLGENEDDEGLQDALSSRQRSGNSSGGDNNMVNRSDEDQEEGGYMYDNTKSGDSSRTTSKNSDQDHLRDSNNNNKNANIAPNVGASSSLSLGSAGGFSINLVSSTLGLGGATNIAPPPSPRAPDLGCDAASSSESDADEKVDTFPMLPPTSASSNTHHALEIMAMLARSTL